MSTTQTALTAHLVTPSGNPGDAFLLDTCRELNKRFGIGHATLQIENRHRDLLAGAGSRGVTTV